MMRTTSRILLALVAGVLAMAGASVPGGAQAAPLPSSAVSDCVGQKKVWLLVVTDGGSTLANRCVGTPGSGEAALASVGFTYAPSSSLICTIGGYPSKCPTTFNGQYWSYWYAKPGGSWIYSNLGAGNRTPPPGSFEGWCYTKQASAATQKSTCIAQLNSRVNPAAIVPTVPQPTKAPTTSKPTTAPTTAKPTTAKPTTAKPTTAKPTATKASTAKATSKATSNATKPASTSASSSKASASSATSSKATSSKATASSATKPSSASTSASATSSATSGQPSATSEETPVTATVTESGSPTGLIATAGVLALGAAGVGTYVLRARRR